MRDPGNEVSVFREYGLVLIQFLFLFSEFSDSLLQKMFSLAVYEAHDVGIPLLQSIQLLNLH